jgi:hypothetical protein
VYDDDFFELRPDQFGKVSTMPVSEQNGVLRLGAETPLFRWYNQTSSNVTWDGSAYVVGWIYSSTGDLPYNQIPFGPHWAGTARVTESGFVFDRRFAVIGAAETPSIAANNLGETALAISEIVPPSYVSRARLYFTSDMSPSPTPPAAPPTVLSHFFGGNKALIEWGGGDHADGFLIERWDTHDETWVEIGMTSAEVNTFTTSAHIDDQFRVTAFGPGGVSQSTVAFSSSSSLPRRHASH